MKPDYKNWVPKGMIVGLFAGAVICLVLFFLFGLRGLLLPNIIKIILKYVFLFGTLLFAAMGIWSFLLSRQFSYKGKRKLSKYIIEGIADYIEIPNGGKGLDVGCGSGALAIACAKRNPEALMIGIDRWGKEYASFSKVLCESNAEAEGTGNVIFQQGNALDLKFDDESFDAVCSNYVYHNIPKRDLQVVLLETLRVLKKNGVFAIHDNFSKPKYGNMEDFMKKLKKMGYEKVELIKTTNGMFMSESEARWMGLAGSMLLIGRK